MYTVLLADDETIIRNGLHYIIDWQSKDFTIIGEASNGQIALELILEKKPDVVLLDIRMPKMNGIEVIKEARKAGYDGKVIILSGYSDFKYAQEAIRYGVVYYLTKPIDAMELEKDMDELHSRIEEERTKQSSLTHYQENAKKDILKSLLLNSATFTDSALEVFGDKQDVYKVVLYEKFGQSVADISYNLPSMLRVTNQGNADFDTTIVDNFEAIVLKGHFAIIQFERFVQRLNGDWMPQKGSPLDSLFLACGREVHNLKEIHFSYDEALMLMRRRFFCRPNQHTINYTSLPDYTKMKNAISPEVLDKYCTEIVSAVQVNSRIRVNSCLTAISEELFYSYGEISEIKIYLADLFIRIKEQLSARLFPEKINFPSNSQIIGYIQNRYFLYQIIDFYSEELSMILDSLTYSQKDSIIEEVAAYISKNYMENIKLENLADLFGYNSSYLGKAFTAKIGVNFNSYLDNVRIENAIRLLETTDYKVYNIAARVGYKNVDAFHKKFKKITGYTPADYKRKTSMTRNNVSHEEEHI